jgi:hypothetical protein
LVNITRDAIASSSTVSALLLRGERPMYAHVFSSPG